MTFFVFSLPDCQLLKSIELKENLDYWKAQIKSLQGMETEWARKQLRELEELVAVVYVYCYE